MTAIGLVLVLLGGLLGVAASGLNRIPSWVSSAGGFLVSLGVGMMLGGVIIALWRWMP